MMNIFCWSNESVNSVFQCIRINFQSCQSFLACSLFLIQMTLVRNTMASKKKLLFSASKIETKRIRSEVPQRWGNHCSCVPSKGNEPFTKILRAITRQELPFYNALDTILYDALTSPITNNDHAWIYPAVCCWTLCLSKAWHSVPVQVGKRNVVLWYLGREGFGEETKGGLIFQLTDTE